MNTFKKTVFCAFAMLFVVGCGDTERLAGTSEETNDFAEYVSSSSEHDEDISSSSSKREKLSSSVQESSSSKTIKPVEGSSSSQKLSSSSRVASSSSVKLSSSSKIPEPAEGSSSSVKQSSSSRVASSSSEKLSSSSEHVNTSQKTSSSSERGESTHTPPTETAVPNQYSLDYYLKSFALDSGKFDNGILSAKVERGKGESAHDGEKPPAASDTEFDGPWPHKFVKQNVYAIGLYFPNASKDYSEIITAIKNETLDENCGLYMFNVRGDGLSAGFVVADIAKDTVTVLDIAAGNCGALAPSDIARFLFYYCGTIESRPEIVHVPVESNLSAKQCPNLKNNVEWVKDNSKTP